MEELDDTRNLADLATEVCDVLDAAVKSPAEARVLARVIESLLTNDVEQPAGARAKRRSALSMRSAVLEIIKAEAAKSPMTFQLRSRPAPATSTALYMRLYLNRNGRIVAVKELLGLFPDKAIETALKVFEEGGSSYDGVEVWSFTRRIFGLGGLACEPGAEAFALVGSD